MFLKVLQTRCEKILVDCDHEECVRAVAHSTASRFGMPTGVTAVERSQANGRAEQRVGALRERLHITVQDVRRTRAEVMFGHFVAQSAECIQSFSVKSGVRLSGGGTIKRTFMVHTLVTQHQAARLDSWSGCEVERTTTNILRMVIGTS